MPRFLLITPIKPGTGYGGAERTLSILRALQNLGEVDTFLIRERADDEATAPAGPFSIDHPAFGGRSSWWWRIYHARFAEFRVNATIARRVAALHAERRYDAFVCRYACGLLSGCWRLGPSFIDLDDVPTDRRTLSLPGWGTLRHTAMNRALEPFAGVLVTKRADVAKVRHTRVNVLPCISTQTPASVDGARPNGPGRILMVGSLRWPPNRAAVDRFCRQSFAEVRRHVPGVVLRIVGAHPELAPRLDGVEAVGFVEDLHTEYAEASVVLCAVREGAGSNVKLAEAARFGVPIVAATFAANGFEGILRPGVDMLVAESDADIAAACTRLLQDPELAGSLGTSAAAKACECLSQEAIDRTIRTLLIPHLRTEPTPSV